ncbi:MAG: hypothetical protein MSIBF_06105 [Candidatus Altiarchaeales archaeon IMC4]|nr:MAG: hypothetical protein MSIBF_06105 [Candidatus Altiarchaeales archaeon IMC4]
MAGLLSQAGFSISTDADADILIINTCTVKTPTENKIIKLLKGLTGKKVIVTGCMPAANPSFSDDFPEFSFIGTNVQDIVAAVECTASGGRFVKISKIAKRFWYPEIARGNFMIGAPSEKVCTAKIRKNPVVEIVQISEGCLGGCAYCLTKSARGDLISYPLEKIVSDIKGAVSTGAKEIWLTSQDTGAYGKDIGGSLPHLIRAVCEIEGDFRVRVGMMNPNHVLGFPDDLIKAYKNEKLYKFLHLPVQSGDDGVLSAMGRKYKAEDFARIVKRFRAEISGVTISTDVICGLPGEDDKAFENTLELIRRTMPDVMNISRFWPRAGTKAAGMKQHPGRVTKARSRRMNEIFKEIALENNKKWIGWQGEAFVCEANEGNYNFTARNFAYKPILLKSRDDLFGRRINVRIKGATFYDFRGAVV